MSAPVQRRGFSARSESERADINSQARAEALAKHSPPRHIWFDEAGEIRTRCITDDPNPDCNGCRETGSPTGERWRWTPGGTA